MMQHELDVVIEESFLWSHSTCVLRYIANRDGRFQTFVALLPSTRDLAQVIGSTWIPVPTRQMTRQGDCRLKSCVEANGGFVALTFCGRKNRLGLNSRML